MSSFRSWSNFLSTVSRNPNDNLRTGWATGFTDSSIWILSWHPFKRTTPVNKALYFSPIKLSSPSLSTLFPWKGPMCKKLRLSAVSRLSSVRPSALTNTKSALQPLLLPVNDTSAVKVSRVGNRFVSLYAKSSLDDLRHSQFTPFGFTSPRSVVRPRYK